MSVGGAADPVGDNSRADARDDAEKQHERQHFGPTRDAVAEIAAIGDDMHLRHRHRDAAGKAGKNQEDHQQARRYAGFGARRRRRPFGRGDHRRGGLAAHQQGERQDRRDNDESDAGVGRAPADQRHRQVHQERPDPAGEVVARRHNDHRKPASPDEPVGDVRHQRPEAGPSANSDQAHGPPRRRRGWAQRRQGRSRRPGSGRRRPAARPCRCDPPSVRARSSRKRDRTSSACRAARPPRDRRRIRPAPRAGRR